MRNPIIRLFVTGVAIAALSAPSLARNDSYAEGAKLYSQGNFKGAIPLFEAAIQANRSNQSAYYFEALCYHQLGQRKQAITLYRMVKDYFPKSPEAANAANALYLLGDQTGDPQSSHSGDSPEQALSGQRLSMTPGQQYSSGQGSGASTFPGRRGSTAPLASSAESLPSQVKFPFTRGVSGHLFVNTTVNGRSLRMCFDTGADSCHFGLEQLQTAGVPIPAGGKRGWVSGATGGRTAVEGNTFTISVGSLTRRVVATVQPNYQMFPLLGQNFWAGYDYQVDNADGFVILTKKNSGSTPFDTIDIPYSNMGNDIVVVAKVNGRDCPMIFDTGAGGIAFSVMQLASLGVGIPSDARVGYSRGIGGASKAYVFELGRMELGSMQRTNITVSAMESGPPLPLLGQTFFSNRRFTIDTDKHVIRFWR